MDCEHTLDTVIENLEADLLIKELEAHPQFNGARLNDAQRKYLIHLINSANIPFGMHSGAIEQDRLNVYSPDGDHYLLSLGKKIMAGQVRHQDYVKRDDFLTKAQYLLGNPDFNFWMDLLTAEEGIVETVNSSSVHHPILARLDGLEGRDRVLYSRPLLLVPGVHDKTEIHDWERRNAFNNTMVRRAYQHLLHGIMDLNHKLATPRYS